MKPVRLRRARPVTVQDDELDAGEVLPEERDNAEVESGEDSGSAGTHAESSHAERRPASSRTVWSALAAATAIAIALGGLLGYLLHQSHQLNVATDQRDLFVQTAKRAAVDLTTINYAEADADVARILDSATGAFHDDFQSRAKPFVDLVRQAQSVTQGTVTEAGLESVDGDHAQVVVAVSVKTSNAGVSTQQSRGWRMRLSVQRSGDTAKVSDVQFVP
jgi:Mce-associated membrane protein